MVEIRRFIPPPSKRAKHYCFDTINSICFVGTNSTFGKKNYSNRSFFLVACVVLGEWKNNKKAIYEQNTLCWLEVAKNGVPSIRLMTPAFYADAFAYAGIFVSPKSVSQRYFAKYHTHCGEKSFDRSSVHLEIFCRIVKSIFKPRIIVILKIRHLYSEFT